MSVRQEMVALDGFDNDDEGFEAQENVDRDDDGTQGKTRRGRGMLTERERMNRKSTMDK